MRLIKAAAAMFAAAALVIAPAAQADDAEIPNPESPIKVSNIKVTNKQAHAWQLVDLTADWSVDNPQSGQTMTIALGDGLRWGARTGFDLKLKDTDIAVGSCTAVAGGTTLTCTLNDEAAKWDTLTGTLEAASQISDQLIGQTGSEITVNGTTVAVVFGDTDGDGVCDVDCGGLLPEQASKSIFKSGWLSSRGEDGTYNWTWNVNVSGSTQYTVVDPGATFSSVYCTNSDWSNGWRVDPTVTGDTVAWTVDSTDTVCRARFTTTSTTASATNAATVNGQEYSHTAWMNAWGRGNADGSMNPTPTPTETPTVPPCPPAPSDTPTDVPTDTPTDVPTDTPAPTCPPAPTDTPTDVPTDTPTDVPTDAPSDTPTDVPSDAPAPTATTTASASGLARTGANTLPLAIGAGVLVLGGGAVLLLRRRRQNGA